MDSSNKLSKLVILLAIILYAVTWRNRPGPGPKPEPPMPVKKLHVLVVEETTARPSLKPAQLMVLQSVAIRRYVQQQGGEFRQIDKDVSTDKMDKVWQDAMKLKRDSLPWWIVSNGEGGVSEALPADLDKAMTTLEKHK